jgi:hypothetical protein
MSHKMQSTRLTNLTCLKIERDNTQVMGGNQHEYTTYTQQRGGCGPVAAANIIAYLAKSNACYAPLFKPNINNQTMHALMMTVYRFVKPFELYQANRKQDVKRFLGVALTPTLGVSSWKRMAKGIIQYGKTVGVVLHAVNPEKRATYENNIDFIKQALKQNRPVAFLNLFAPMSMNYCSPHSLKAKPVAFHLHWVVITGLAQDDESDAITLEVLTWGGRGFINAYQLKRTNLIKKICPYRLFYIE